MGIETPSGRNGRVAGQWPSMPLCRDYHLTAPMEDLPPKDLWSVLQCERRAELVPALIVLPYGMAMRSPLMGFSAFENADDLTGCGPASISCPRQFALLTRVGHDTVPCAPGLLVRRNAPTPTKGDQEHGTQDRSSNHKQPARRPRLSGVARHKQRGKILLEQGRCRVETQRRPRLHDRVRRRMIWNGWPDFGAESFGSSGSGYAA